MHTSRATRLSPGLLVIALLGPPAAIAQPSLGPDAPVAAEGRYAIARALYLEGRYAEAAAEFDVAFAMMPGSGKLAYNAARCHERAGNLERALERYDDYLRLSPEATDRAQVEATVAAIRERLVQRLPELVLTSQPAGARVAVDDDPPLAQPTPVTARVSAGEHVVRFELEGHRPVSQPVSVVAGQTNAAHVELLSSATEPRGRDGPPWIRTAGWVGVGLGVAGLGLAAVYGAQASSAKDEGGGLDAAEWRRHEALRDDYEQARTVAWVGLAAGLALAAAGTTLLLWPQDEAPEGVALVPGGARW